jgi:endonuclease/exonuclease/phosphatase family metal-dependent hydrolase
MAPRAVHAFVRAIDRILAGVAIIAATVVVLTWLVPGGTGPYALLTILAPHGVLAIVAVGAVVAVVGGQRTRWALLVLVVVAALRFGSEWVSFPAGVAEAPDLTVATWNLEYGDVDGAEAVAGLRDLDVDLVALQELTPEQAASIEASSAVSERFPYRQLNPRPGVAGIGLLSRHPLLDPIDATAPVSLQATIERPGGRITVLTAHPYPARIETVTPLRLPVGFDPSDRDALLQRLRERIDTAIERGGDVVVLGDFNVAPTEPAFGALTTGLIDSHLDAGVGPGWTWRPSRLESLPIGLLRIDLVLSTRQLVPVESRVECPRIGDHCRVIAAFASPF